MGGQIPLAALDRDLGLGIAISVPKYQWSWWTMADMGAAWRGCLAYLGFLTLFLSQNTLPLSIYAQSSKLFGPFSPSTLRQLPMSLNITVFTVFYPSDSD